MQMQWTDTIILCEDKTSFTSQGIPRKSTAWSFPRGAVWK